MCAFIDLFLNSPRSILFEDQLRQRGKPLAPAPPGILENGFSGLYHPSALSQPPLLGGQPIPG